ncbi:hypothetical protein D3C73_833460 [compost metagenome]
MLKRRFAQPEQSVDIGFECGIELLCGKVGNLRDKLLHTRDIRQNINTSQLLHRGSHELFTVLLILQITRHGDCGAAGFLH